MEVLRRIRAFDIVGPGTAITIALVRGAFTLDGGYAFDDHRALEQNPVVLGSVPAWEAFVRSFWGVPLTEGMVSYRPLMTLLWRALWALGGGSPFPFHALNAIAHAAATALAYSVTATLLQVSLPSSGWGTGGWGSAAPTGADHGDSRLPPRPCPPRTTATLVALLFAAHPLASQAIGANVGAADLLATLCGLAALRLYLAGITPLAGTSRPPTSTAPQISPQEKATREAQPRVGQGLAAALVLLAGALFKESVVVFGCGLLVVSAFRARERRELGWVPILFVLLFIVGLQLSFERTLHNWGGSLAAAANGGQRVLLGAYLLGRGFAMCFIPHRLSPSHGHASIALANEALLPWALVGVVVLLVALGSLWFLVRGRHLPGLLAWLLLFLPLLLITNWFVLVPSELPERVLYASTLGACGGGVGGLQWGGRIAIGWLASRRGSRRGSVEWVSIAAIGLTASGLVQSYHVQRPWHDELALWEHAMLVEPRASQVQLNAAIAAKRRGELDLAAFRLVVAAHVANSFPRPVDFAPVHRLEQLPLQERIVEAPALLRPAQECTMVHGLLQVFRHYLPQYNALPLWQHRYPQCFVRRRR